MCSSNRMISIAPLMAALCLVVGIEPAHAQPDTDDVELTMLSGVTMAAPRRALSGVVGHCRSGGSSSVCGEFELAHIFEDSGKRAPATVTFSMNFLVRFKSPVPHMKFYGIYGRGLHYETGMYASSGLESQRSLGGGGVLTLAGRLKLRLEYRMFFLHTLNDQLFQEHPQRLSAGLVVSL